MLCVHLKRFRHDLSYSSKITSPVNFPLKGLDMSSYLHKECKSQVSTYDLTAVICHHGTVGGGHYTCFAKHQLSGYWYEYDDQLVTEVSEEIVQNCEAYVLFYRKSNLKIIRVREQAQLVELSAEQAAADISFYISKQWLHKFNTFAEPGPIDNWALLCPHGALPPAKAKIKSQLVVPLPQPLWDFLYEKFGGGPAFNHLYECDVCLRAAEAMTRRQAFELEAFQTYRDEMSSTIYAISMSWLRQWQSFIGSSTIEEPGPINNAAIVNQLENGKYSVKPGSDYAQITASLWKFFYRIYGGGPEIIVRGAPPASEESKEQKLKMEMDALSLDANQSHSMEHSSNKNIVKHSQSERIVVPSQTDGMDVSVAYENGAGDSCPPAQQSPSLPQQQQQQQQQPPAAVAQPQTKKIVKNVSFENDENFHDKHNTSSGQESIIVSNLKRSKQPSQSAFKSSNNVGSNEIVSKRDKRHHGDITANGLFGPDGIYSDYTQYNNIPDDIANNLKKSSTIDASASSPLPTSSILMSYNHHGSPEPNEMTQLLNDHKIASPDSATVTSTTSTPNATSTVNNSTISKDLHSFRNTSNKYKKKFKVKSARKYAPSLHNNSTSGNSNNNNEVNLSDSDKN